MKGSTKFGVTVPRIYYLMFKQTRSFETNGVIWNFKIIFTAIRFGEQDQGLSEIYIVMRTANECAFFFLSLRLCPWLPKTKRRINCNWNCSCRIWQQVFKVIVSPRMRCSLKSARGVCRGSWATKGKGGGSFSSGSASDETDYKIRRGLFTVTYVKCQGELP